MILVEYTDETSETSLSFDREGGALLIEMIQQLIDAPGEDHFHLSEGPEEIAGWKQLPEFCALTIKQYNPRAGTKCSEILTLCVKDRLPK